MINYSIRKRKSTIYEPFKQTVIEHMDDKDAFYTILGGNLLALGRVIFTDGPLSQAF